MSGRDSRVFISDSLGEREDNLRRILERWAELHESRPPAEQGKCPDQGAEGPESALEGLSARCQSGRAVSALNWYGETSNPLFVARNRVGLSRPEASRLSGVPRNTLRNMETGESARRDYLLALAEVYGMTLDELLGRDVDSA